MPPLPDKLKIDAIAEAICEVRFESVESRDLPELAVSRLAEFSEWKMFKKQRLPIWDIPAPMRMRDPNLKNQPLMELRNADGTRIVKFGANVFSYHVLAPYPGWAAFQPELGEVLEFLFQAFEDFSAKRIGFRYINILNEVDHGLRDITQLNLSVAVAEDQLNCPLNLNFIEELENKSHTAMVRVASPEFVTAPPEIVFSASIDIDVYTPIEFSTNDINFALGWIETAHGFEKKEFFNLFTNEMLAELVDQS